MNKVMKWQKKSAEYVNRERRYMATLLYKIILFKISRFIYKMGKANTKENERHRMIRHKKERKGSKA